MNINFQTLEAAELIFERSRGRVITEAELQQIRETSLESLTESEIADAIWSWLKLNQSDELRSFAYFIIGKRYNQDDKLRLITALTIELDRDVNVAYQVMIALDNLNEPVFSPARCGYSINEKELNFEDASSYLKHIRKSSS